MTVVDSDGVDPSQVANAEGFNFPTWGRDAKLLVTENASSSASPTPSDSIFDSQGVVRQANIDGLDPAEAQMFGGMPTVGPEDLPQIAYAGQPAISGWSGSRQENHYNQSANYIFLNSAGTHGYASTTMEPPVTGYDPAYQGRAPAWSPTVEPSRSSPCRESGGHRQPARTASTPSTYSIWTLARSLR